MAATPPVTDALIRVRRAPERGSDDPQVVRAILDAAFLCHLGTVVDGRPVVIPTLYGRDGDALVLHGSAASRTMRRGAAGLPVCATVTLVDGLVLARSAFHQSANYRSVVVHGDAEVVDDPHAKRAALEVLTEHVAPGRAAEVRPPSDAELRATTVLRLPLTHAVAKVRAHGVADDVEDLDLPVWSGVLPLATVAGAPQADGDAGRHPLPPFVAAAAGARPAGAPAALVPPSPAR